MKEIKIDNTWYKVVTDSSNEDTANIKSGNTYDFAIVGNYVVNAKETEASSSDILVVTDYESANQGMQSSSTQKVKAYFLDGTSKTITVEKLSKTAGTSATDVKSSNAITSRDVNKLYTYSTRSNGNYSLEALGDGNKAGYENIKTTDKVTDKNKMDTYSINDDAVIFVLYNDSGDATVKDNVKVLSGKTVNDWKTAYDGAVQYATKKTNGVETVRVAVIAANSKYNGAGSDYKYAYMTSASYEGTNGEDNDKTTVYEAWTGSEDVTLKYDGTASTADQRQAGDILIYTNDGADFINVEKATDVDIYKVAITGIEKKKEGTVAVQGFKVSDNSALKNQSFDMDEDCVYIAVNDDKQEGKTGSSLDQIALAEETSTKGNYYLNAYIVVEKTGDKNILAIVYDADNNRLDGDVVVNSTGAKVTADATYTASISSSITKPSDTVAVGLSKTTGLKAGDKVTVTLTKTDGNTFGAGTYGIEVTGATAPATKAVTAGTSSITFDITVASSNIVVTAVTKA